MDLNDIIKYQNSVLKIKSSLLNHYHPIILNQEFIQLNHKCQNIWKNISSLNSNNSNE
jgi:hypothetical protein